MYKYLLLILLGISLFGCKSEPTVVTKPVLPPDPKIPYSDVSSQRTRLANKPQAVPVRWLDSALIISSMEYLASDVCEGRQPGTAGHQNAQDYIIRKFREAGVDSLKNSFLHSFSSQAINGSTTGYNYVAKIAGTVFPDKYIILTAHYDHLGKTSNAIYSGADDNASGTACLLALAKYFKQHPPAYSLLFAALDREENGLIGAQKLVTEFEGSGFLSSIKFNLNMDMIARSDNNEIFVCGLKHYPAFRYAIDSVEYKTNTMLLKWHDDSGQGDNWTNSSDHGPFHSKQIPFFYIGVEDYPEYHKTGDKAALINKSRYIENCNMIAMLIKYLKP